MQRITSIIKPSILKRGKYQSKVAEDEPEEMPLKQSQPSQHVPYSRGSFRLTKRDDSSRSITSLHSCELVDSDHNLQSSISTFDSSASSIFSNPHDYNDPLSQNNSFSSLKHIEVLKPRRSPAVKDKEERKARQACAVKDGVQVQLRKPRRMSFGNKRSTEPKAVPSTDVPKTNPRRSRADRSEQEEEEVPRKMRSRSLCRKPQVVASTSVVPKTNPRRSRDAQRNTRPEQEEEEPGKMRSRSLCSKRVQRALRSRPKPDSKASPNPNSKANVAPQKSTVQRSKSSRHITDYTDSKANVSPNKKSTHSRLRSSSLASKKITQARSGSLDDFMTQYDDMMVEFPDAWQQEDNTFYDDAKSLTGW